MPAVIISNYKRPGIFINEYDNSVLSSNTVQGITNLVIGVSKTGPINTPVLIQTTQDLTNYFGGIDRTLERKGSFFQRTIAQMIQSSPVYALNLLETDPILDQIQYEPLSTSTNNSNDVIKTGSLSAFYDTTGFWKLSTDSFLSLVSNNENYSKRLLNFTNVSGSYITAFVFKTTATGFDVTMTQWYGSVTNIPSYVYPTDYVSDYMVDVVVVAGDWSNYQSLSVDTNWSKYFDSTGLLKGQVQNFINDRNVTLLKYYQGLSFIPYFRDQNNQNIFIENVINQDTQVTGLFCAFNSDLLEQDFPTGAIDLLGNNLINSDSLLDSNQQSIDFLSYNQQLVTINSYTNTYLDTVGNVYSIDPGPSYDFYNGYGGSIRTNTFAEERVSGVYFNTSTFSSLTAAVSYTVASGNNVYNNQSAYAIIGGNLVNIYSGVYTFSVPATNFASASGTYSYISTIKLDTTGAITNVTSTTPGVNPTVATTDIVLGYMQLNLNSGNIVGLSYSNITVGTNSASNGSFAYNDLQYNTDYVITSSGLNSITLTFTNSAAFPDTSNYTQYRRIKRFNALRTLLESVEIEKAAIMTVIDSTGVYQKFSMANMSISAVTDNTLNKSITISNMGFTSTQFYNYVLPTFNSANGFLIYASDNELILSDNEIITSSLPASNSLIGASAYGVAGQYSTIYQDYYNGEINTGDYFYANVLSTNGTATYTASTIQFINTSGLTGSSAVYNGLNFISIQGAQSGNPFNNNLGVSYFNLMVPDSVLNNGVLTIETDPYGSHPIGYNYTTILGITTSNTYTYLVSDSVTSETLYNINRIWSTDTKYYLAMNIDSNNNLTIKITGNDLYTYQGNHTSLFNNWGINGTFNINSYESNYQETIEIVVPSGYTQVSNQILVNASRYSNINIGDFLLQDNSSADLQVGQQAKNLTRIISKKVYSADTTLSLITCDAAIFKFPVGSPISTTYQTMRYSSLDNYVTTYKAITLKGFRIRQASLPDGTEATQNSILNLVANGTPLYNALINKDAIDFRYLVDSFGLGLTEFSKQQLVDICGGRLNCIGFINMPSIKQFKNSSSPSFTDTLSNGTKVLNTAYIAQGGNLNSNPAFLYSFAEGPGTTCVGYFTPYVTVSDNGNPISVPPAMYAASTYMQKFTTNVTSIVPWTIAAGVQNGLIQGIAGVEIDFSPTDIDNLNGAQMNPIIYKKNRGWIIDTENTALTLYKSALSYLHVREVLIELENALVDMLLNYQWQFNTQDTRAEIKLRADVICAGFVNKNGLYNYFNKCDSENNTNTLIDNQIGVLDTYIEPIKGMAVIVNNITVLKTGAIQAGGFQSL